MLPVDKARSHGVTSRHTINRCLKTKTADLIVQKKTPLISRTMTPERMFKAFVPCNLLFALKHRPCAAAAHLCRNGAAPQRVKEKEDRFTTFFSLYSHHLALANWLPGAYRADSGNRCQLTEQDSLFFILITLEQLL